MKGPGRNHLVGISLPDENGNEKKYYTVRDIINAVVKSYHIDLTGTVNDGQDGNSNYENNLYRKIIRELEPGIKSGVIAKDGKEYKIPADYVWKIVGSEEFIKYIYKFGCKGRERAKRNEQIEQLNRKAEETNKAYYDYMASGQYVADMLEVQSESEHTGEESAINKEIFDYKVDIASQYMTEKYLSNRTGFQGFSQTGEWQAINDEIRKKKFEIIMEYIFENMIELDEDLLSHDVSVNHTALPGDDDSISLCAADRLKNLKNYYKERDNVRRKGNYKGGD